MSLVQVVKIVFGMVVLLLLVLMGVHNRGVIDFNLPPLMSNVVQQPAALMYFAFFAVGLLTGICLMAGSGKKGGGSSKSSKS